ncbi:serine protein kinase RIO [Georgenia subflava]|uniref:non-specific serine/threonine protein kinase n=1 Tax=Georgenia subflava TaxID=1622177 RepID=A0A6N7EKP7_9MICO|nr:RIO1 family regulatory kinase/ATPase [Georgenia subflava]MPV38952.1 serine/threonine protein kinase [Georgenia subflava]
MSSDVFDHLHHLTDTSRPDIFAAGTDALAVDDLGPGRRWSTWLDVERGCRGPEPRPDWVVTEQAALDTELGIVKTGKEADVFLLERAVPDDAGPSVLMAAKRYRSAEHRSFRRDESYLEGRRTRRSRDARALERKSAYGRAVAAGQWAMAEFAALGRLWSEGVPVPYPVQIDGTELLMEYIEADGAPAPRLAQVRPDHDLLVWYHRQMLDAMRVLARAGLAHGDLSPYNVLAQGERLVLIDVPQIVDIVANPHGVDLLQRDCRNVCAWFAARGLETDDEALLADLLGEAFG